MNKKLTLNLDAAVIDRAKIYASEQGTSLSKMIENYLSLITAPSKVEPESGEVELTPLVRSLVGVVFVPDDYDFRSDYTDYLIEKYK